MQKIVALSDTHGNKEDLLKLLPILMECDLILFAGDGVFDFNVLPKEIYQKTRLVKGNCDGDLSQTTLVVEVENCKILLTHGHLYGVKSNLLNLYLKAQSLNCNMVVYGHTHAAKVEEYNDILFVNPGTLSRFSLSKTFAYIVVNNSKVTACINDKFYQNN